MSKKHTANIEPRTLLLGTIGSVFALGILLSIPGYTDVHTSTQLSQSPFAVARTSPLTAQATNESEEPRRVYIPEKDTKNGFPVSSNTIAVFRCHKNTENARIFRENLDNNADVVVWGYEFGDLDLLKMFANVKNAMSDGKHFIQQAHTKNNSENKKLATLKRFHANKMYFVSYNGTRDIVVSCNHGIEFANICGNGVQEKKETCDDGNIQNGDGCSATCSKESTTENESVEQTCPPCAPPPNASCKGLGPCGCGPYECTDSFGGFSLDGGDTGSIGIEAEEGAAIQDEDDESTEAAGSVTGGTSGGDMAHEDNAEPNDDNESVDTTEEIPSESEEENTAPFLMF